MARVKRGFKARRRRKRVLKAAKGFFGSRNRLFKVAKVAVMHAWYDAYKGRRLRKRDMRRLWITRINAGARLNGMSYSKLMGGLRKAEVALDAVTAEARALEESVIRPGRISAVADGAPTSGRMAMTSLSPYLLIAALLFLVLDIGLLIRSRRRAAHA